jgi:glycine cleavage system H protein
MAQIEKYFLPDDLYYDPKDHLWAKIEPDGRVRIGLDEFGQQAAGTVVYIKLLPAGRPAKKGRAFGSLEAGKYVGPLKAPVNGTIAVLNQAVIDRPAIVNTDPYGEGWFVVIEPSDLEEDVKDLIHGEAAITAWVSAEIADYRQKGWLKAES